jgi:hypothetical protein
MEFDGTGDYLLLPSNDSMLLTGDFTIEAWVYRTVGSVDQGIFSTIQSSGNVGVGLVITSANKLRFRIGIDGSTDLVTDANNFSLNTWTHCAVTRSGNTITLYKDGVSVATGSTTRTVTSNLGVIGRFYNTFDGFYFTGFIDDVRVTKGVARTISLPTSAYPDQ